MVRSMVRRMIQFTDAQDDALQVESKRVGNSIASIVRSCVDNFFDKQGNPITRK